MSAKQIAGYTVYPSQILGRGSFGNVCRGIKDDTGERLAVKIIPKYKIEENQYLSASLNNEINILRQIHSDNVVRFLDLKETANNYYIIQELCEGDLGKIMRVGGEMKESTCIDILTQLCTGFYELVRQNITHRDLKPANILISGDKFKLADFGFSKKLVGPSNEENMKMVTYVGTPLYMSPEILMSRPYTNKCDIWALGFIFYEMLHGLTPWVGGREYELIENIKSQPLTIRRKDLSHETVDFLVRALKVNESDRLSWAEVFEHPIFKGYFKELANKEQGEYLESTMKGIMVKLRQCFNLNKYSLEEFLNQYGFKDKQEDLSFDRYFQFLKLVYKDISEEEAIFIFKRTDTDNSGTISVEEIIQMLKQYGFDEPSTLSIVESEASQAAWERMKEVFVKLHKVIERNHLSLEKVFSDFSKDKPSMKFSEFKTMVQKMCKNISDQEARLAFKEIDQDGSDSLEFQELKKYYLAINNL